MFFVLSKVFAFFTVPSNFAAMIALAGLALLATRWRRPATNVMGAGIALLLLLGFSPLGNILMLTLTERFPAWKDDGRIPAGIIVLGGAINPEISAARNDVELNASAERMTAVAGLARRFAQARIVFTGGNSNLLGGIAEAEIALPMLESFGIARDRIMLETRSRTTFENAVFTRDMLTPKPGDTWLLVTSANHMPRSIGVFRAAGFDVVPYPVDWRTRGWSDALTPFDRLSAGLSRTDTAAHEWIGLMAYWLTGRSSALFPAPAR